jgi:hypothetical protein
MTAHCSKISPDYPSLGKMDPEFAAQRIAQQMAQSIRNAQPDPEELKAAYQHIARLTADLLECREYLEGHVDVVDGDNGEPAPNRAMQLVSLIDESLHGPGGF